MKVIFLDIDGVLATPRQYNTVRTKLYKRDGGAAELRVPYLWDERCVIALNRFILLNDVEIVLSSDWRRHFNMEELDKIFKINGVAKSPISCTGIKMKETSAEDLESIRVREIQQWLDDNPPCVWCAIDDLDLSALHGGRFVKTDERMGIGAKDILPRLEKHYTDQMRQIVNEFKG